MTVSKSKSKTTALESDADLGPILPRHGEILVGGIPAVVKRLRSREFLNLIRVLTIGLGPNVADVDLSGEKEEMQGKVIALFLMAIPEAIDEFGEFLFSVVEAKDPHDNNDLQKAMKNPEIEVLLDVITVIVEQEKDDFASLVGKAKAALTRIQSLYRPTGR